MKSNYKTKLDAIRDIRPLINDLKNNLYEDYDLRRKNDNRKSISKLELVCKNMLNKILVF